MWWVSLPVGNLFKNTPKKSRRERERRCFGPFHQNVKSTFSEENTKLAGKERTIMCKRVHLLTDMVCLETNSLFWVGKMLNNWAISLWVPVKKTTKLLRYLGHKKLLLGLFRFC